MDCQCAIIFLLVNFFYENSTSFDILLEFFYCIAAFDSKYQSIIIIPKIKKDKMLILNCF